MHKMAIDEYLEILRNLLKLEDIRLNIQNNNYNIDETINDEILSDNDENINNIDSSNITLHSYPKLSLNLLNILEFKFKNIIYEEYDNLDGLKWEILFPGTAYRIYKTLLIEIECFGLNNDRGQLLQLTLCKLIKHSKLGNYFDFAQNLMIYWHWDINLTILTLF